MRRTNQRRQGTETDLERHGVLYIGNGGTTFGSKASSVNIAINEFEKLVAFAVEHDVRRSSVMNVRNGFTDK